MAGDTDIHGSAVHFRSSIAPALVLAAYGAAFSLRALAQRLDGRIATRTEAANDRCLLDGMSEHELRDIGVSRTDLPSSCDGSLIPRHDGRREAGTFFPYA